MPTPQLGPDHAESAAVYRQRALWSKTAAEKLVLFA